MEDENNTDEKISTIEFFIDAAKYHYGNLKNKLAENDQPEIDKGGFGEIMQERKVYGFGIPITVEFEEGYAIELYEFYSFVNAVMASVNNIIDLKCRVTDGYSGHYSFSFGQYMKPKNPKKLPLFKSSVEHELIIENSDWIQRIKEIRDIVQHQPIQKFIQAHIVFKAEKGEDGNITNRSFVKTYVPLRNKEPKEILDFCDESITNIETFWHHMKSEI